MKDKDKYNPYKTVDNSKWRAVIYIWWTYKNSSTNHPVNVFALLKGLVQGLCVSDDAQVKIFRSLK